jgi:hypothetical protein
MNQTLLPPIPPPPSLAARIIARIRMLELRVARIRAWLFGSSAVASIAGAGAAIWYGTSVVLNSAFYQYLTLVVSDTTALTSLWKELLLSLLESFPVIETTAVFVAVYLVVLLTQRAARYGLLVSHLQKTT